MILSDICLILTKLNNTGKYKAQYNST